MDEENRSGEGKKPARRRSGNGKRILRTGAALCLTAAVAAGATWFVMDRQNRENAPYARLLEAVRIIEDDYIGEVDTDAVIDGAIDGMLTGLGDRWSYYVPQDEMADHMDSVNNSYVGVGVTVTKEENEGILITDVAEGGGAAEAGLVPGDRIVAVDGQSLLELTLEEAKKLVKGEENTYVTLTVQHENGEQADYSVQRRTVQTETVLYEMIGDVGYIRIVNFNVGVAERFIQAVDALQQQEAQGLVFDVRFNGGGRLSELMDMLDKLLPEGLIFSSRDNTGKESSVYSDADCVELPMAVLVNDNTYSAAEFFAEALREYDWATVVGQHTTGKGYSQSTIYLSDGSAIVLSTKAYFTPEGKSLADVGIQPDIEKDISDTDYYNLYLGRLAHEDDEQLQLALENVQEKIN